MDGHDREERGTKRRFKMKTFTIDNENSISAFATAEEAAAITTTPFDSFSTQKELAELAKAWPAERLVAIWNSLPGVAPVESFKSNKAAVGRIWARIQGIGDATEPEAAPARPKPGKKAKGRPQSAKSKPPKGKSAKKATAAKAAPKGKKAALKGKKAAKAQEAQAKESGEPKTARAGSKSEGVIAMLKRKGGATLAEIMAHTGWQKHTTRGWVSGFLGKKMGIAVESFKSDKGERVYRINK
jgi:hypothetical protein